METTKGKRVAVTGSTGMLGGHLVAELLRRGYGDIILPVRSSARLAALETTLAREGFAGGLPPALRPVEAALNDPNALRGAFEGVEVVFHCAAAVSMSDRNPRELIETNVEITDHVVDAAIDCSVRRLVHTSSVAALGEARRAGEPIDEGCDLEGLSGTSPYGVSKFLSENRARRAAAFGVEVVVVNPGIILGQGDWRSGGSTLIVPLAASGIPFYPSGAMGYVDVRDVARAEVLLGEAADVAGERFILVSENLTYRELITCAALAAGHRPPSIRAGRRAMGAAWRAAAAVAALTGRPARLTRWAALSASRASLYDGSRITRLLPGFGYTPVRETIERVVKAYRNSGY